MEKSNNSIIFSFRPQSPGWHKYYFDGGPPMQTKYLAFTLSCATHTTIQVPCWELLRAIHYNKKRAKALWCPIKLS